MFLSVETQVPICENGRGGKKADFGVFYRRRALPVSLSRVHPRTFLLAPCCNTTAGSLFYMVGRFLPCCNLLRILSRICATCFYLVASLRSFFVFLVDCAHN